MSTPASEPGVAVADLAHLELLRDLEEGVLDELARRLVRRTYAPDDVVLRQGDHGGEFVILLAGEVRVERDVGDAVLRLGHAGVGSIFGELSAITGDPRRATVTAATAVSVAIGDHLAFDALIQIPVVLDRLIALAAPRLAEIARPVPVVLADGAELMIRPLVWRDRATFQATIERQDREWWHRRFFSAAAPSRALIDYLVHLDYLSHFAWVIGVAEPLEGVGTARFIRSRDDRRVAELAFEVADEWHGRGIATVLLGALGAAAERSGIDTFRAEALYENRAMRAVLRKAGAHWEHVETGVMATVFPVAGTRGLVPEPVHRALGDVAEEIVTVAGLALRRDR